VRTLVVEHPVVADRLTVLRDKTTSRPDFRRALHQLSLHLLYEALADQPTVMVDIDTPLAPMPSRRITEPPIVVPVMRAGLGMLDAALELLPDARVGFVGLKRNEQTHLPHAYVNTVPERLDGRRVLIIDPMLATGGSARHTIELLLDAGAGGVTLVCVLSAPEGIATIESIEADLTLVTAAIDERLNDSAFIHPGLGDAGDRQFGLA
jgi:uracil phosphoribosyltransferase